MQYFNLEPGETLRIGDSILVTLEEIIDDEAQFVIEDLGSEDSELETVPKACDDETGGMRLKA
jgi:hypothetical protein